MASTLDFTEACKKQEDFTKKVSESTAPGITQSKVMKIYDDWAGTYEQDVKKGHYFAPDVTTRATADMLGGRKDARILDAAAGTGLVGKMLYGLGYTNIDALDANGAMLEEARKKNVYKNLICDFMGPNRLKIQDDYYDVVVTTGSFTNGHVKHDCFPEMIRIIKPGGLFIIVMLEEYLFKVEVYRDHLENAMQALEEEKKWRRIKRQKVANYSGGKPGVVFVFEIL